MNQVLFFMSNFWSNDKLLQLQDDFIEKSCLKFVKSQPFNFNPEHLYVCQNNNIYKMTADYYDILEVAKTASKEDIKKS